jgi:UDP-N-acetylglucosamine/UDP-N-acetylgalactosamine diphosphorylase
MNAPSAPIDAVLKRGVLVPRPDLVALDPEVDPARIEAGAQILPGARIEGARTVIGRGSRIGTGGPVVLRNCALGRGVELASGAFEECVFFDGASYGPSAHARAGTLFEERARAAHCVGTKHTILLPFVTLGSLINFCDCLMGGGTGDGDHSEVGSGFVHFNFTPFSDKATPSMFGDVVRGAFLREPRIFLGGNAGAVGPVRVGFGSVLAAGSVYRRDYGERMLALGEGARSESRKLDLEIVRGARTRVRKNLEYVAELAALLAFHSVVRARLFAGDPWREALGAAAVASIKEALAERVRQLEKFGAVLVRSAGQLAAAVGPGSSELAADVIYQREFPERLARARAGLLAAEDPPAAAADRDVLSRTLPGRGGDYLEWVRRLEEPALAAGRRWLGAVRAASLDAAARAGL